MRADLAAAFVLGISRNKASELIKLGKIYINDRILDKPSLEVDESADIKALDTIYVSRAALKLKGFLEKIKFNPFGLNALDIGSSTGGFVQVLLENGVKSVTALDVGSNQLDSTLRSDARVIVRENTDIRDFKEGKFDLVTIDVSFISVLLILKDIDRLAKRDIILLHKPQFEVGKDVKRNSKGVVKDKKQILLSQKYFQSACSELGWECLAKKECVITGKEGNLESFYHYRKK
ncbi:23S rRNA (cytidine-2'-O)-methyltransferase TlyA [Campylobacter hyointestinalis]|uniref:23S rRNA (cytidine-2'-O)-methyltransferase TlyA n=1 Tax=Campylobacter hyointestinalis TaxID=198 RepID=UPI000DCBC8E0|nr:TlyA family RNA methyltransferase [Campylobacter hyointestinalis]RAZ60209.1 TlyA family RNA methyltransferase [Campylobacter hyointestinalis subsp. lawsonii]